MKNKAILFALAPLMAVGTLFGTCPAAYAATNAVASAKAKVELPPYLKEDFNSACEKAKKEGRLVFVSLGHREYFYSTFDPPDRKLPFVGVMDGDRTAVKEAISGSHTPEEYQKLMSDE